MQTINLKAPLTAGDAAVVARANQLRERAQSVQASLSAPGDSVHLDAKSSNEGLGLYYYKGEIGADKFATATAQMTNGKMDSLVAFDAPKGAPAEGESIKWFLTTSQATGLRAGLAAALGGMAGGLGNAAVWMTAEAIKNYSNSSTAIGRGAATLLEWASRPLSLGHDVLHLAERKVGDPGTKDDFYGVYKQNGEAEQFTFTTRGTLEYEHFAPRP